MDYLLGLRIDYCPRDMCQHQHRFMRSSSRPELFGRVWLMLHGCHRRLTDGHSITKRPQERFSAAASFLMADYVDISGDRRPSRSVYDWFLDTILVLRNLFSIWIRRLRLSILHIEGNRE